MREDTTATTRKVTVTKTHRIKGLQKERVPINIGVGHNNTKGFTISLPDENSQ
jgi:hypothetical protein